jgi:hypothetical protein
MFPAMIGNMDPAGFNSFGGERYFSATDLSHNGTEPWAGQ